MSAYLDEFDDIEDLFDFVEDNFAARDKRHACIYSCPDPPPHRGLFSSPNRSNHRWYTPTYGDNLWSLSRRVLVFVFATHGVGRNPTSSEIQDVMDEIRNHPCNERLRGKMFLPRFSKDRCTGRGIHYGMIYIPFVFD